MVHAEDTLANNSKFCSELSKAISAGFVILKLIPTGATRRQQHHIAGSDFCANDVHCIFQCFAIVAAPSGQFIGRGSNAIQARKPRGELDNGREVRAFAYASGDQVNFPWVGKTFHREQSCGGSGGFAVVNPANSITLMRN